MANNLPFKAVSVKEGDYLLMPGKELAQIKKIPEVRPEQLPVAWATIIETNYPKRVGQTLIVSLFAIVAENPQPGQIQLVKSRAQTVKIIPIEQKDLKKLSPIEYVLYIESDGKVMPLMLELAGEYEGLSDKKLLGLLESRDLSMSGITYQLSGKPENFIKSKGLFLRVHRPSVIGRLAYHEWLEKAPPPKTAEEIKESIATRVVEKVEQVPQAGTGGKATESVTPGIYESESLEDQLAKLASLLDKGNKATSIKALEKAMAALPTEQVEGMDEVETAIGDYRGIEKAGMTPEEYQAEKQASWDAISDAVEGLGIKEEG